MVHLFKISNVNFFWRIQMVNKRNYIPEYYLRVKPVMLNN